MGKSFLLIQETRLSFLLHLPFVLMDTAYPQMNNTHNILLSADEGLHHNWCIDKTPLR